MIRSLEYENAMLSSEELRLASLLDTVRNLRNLTVLSLPDCVDVGANQTIAGDLNACLKVSNQQQTRPVMQHYSTIWNDFQCGKYFPPIFNE